MGCEVQISPYLASKTASLNFTEIPDPVHFLCKTGLQPRYWLNVLYLKCHRLLLGAFTRIARRTLHTVLAVSLIVIHVKIIGRWDPATTSLSCSAKESNGYICFTPTLPYLKLMALSVEPNV